MAAKIRKGDTVIVLAGRDKGSSGKVLEVRPKESRVVVEGVNLVKRHTKPDMANPNGGVLSKEAALHISNVMLFDPKAGKGVRVGVRISKDGTRERISRATGDTISKSE